MKEQEKDEKEESPFFEYLASEKGHVLASRIITLIEELKKVTIDRNAEQSKIDSEFAHRHRRNLLIQQSIVFVIGIISATVLTYYGKFDSTIGVLFGTLVGYFFGRRNTP